MDEDTTLKKIKNDTENVAKAEEQDVSAKAASPKGGKWYKDYASRAAKEETSAPASHVRYGRRLIVLVVFFLFFIAAYGVFLFIIQTKEARISAIAAELGKNAVKEKEFGELRDLVNRSGGKIDTLNSYFISSSRIVELIQSIENLGATAGIALSFTSVSEKKDGDSASIEMQFKTGGSFDGTMYFLTLVENLPLKLSFEKVFIEKQSEKSGRETEPLGAWKGTFSVFVQSVEPLQ